MSAFHARLTVALAAATLWASAATAQAPTVPLQHPRVRQALDSIRAWQAWTLRQQIELTEIEAPPFKEARRAEEFRRRLVALGYQDARIDAEGNVIAERSGEPGGPVIVISGHLDTVFPEGTDVRVNRVGNRLSAPGIADDGRGLAVVLTVARALRAVELQTGGTVVFVGTVGEEGQGDLRGVRHLFGEEMRDRVDFFISVDGTGFGITTAAVGSIRYRVSYHGPGGHSYASFGMPNPMHALGRAIAAMADMEVPAAPRTTFSVSVASGGTSVNSIPMEAVMEIDMRSEDPGQLAHLDQRVRGALKAALVAEKTRWPRSTVPLSLAIDTIGIRPGGRQPDPAVIVDAALAAASALGVTSGQVASSTDANLPISLGIPAITIDGGGRGGGAHAVDEWYEETADSFKGPQWALLIAATLAGVK